MTAAIVADRLTKHYRLRRLGARTLKELLLRQYAPGDEVVALRDVNFEVETGETFGVIGANGSGKSTLLKLIAGTTRPTSGRLRVEGRVSALLELGVGFHPDFTGRENVQLTGSILGLGRREIEAAIPSIEEFAEIGRFFDAPVKTYSSGMYTRLAFAVAVHVDPDVLLIDEVLAVGDEYFQRRCFAKISDFRRREKTIVFVSHDLAAVSRICSRALLLDDGVVRHYGDVREVIDRYREIVRGKHQHAPAAAPQSSERWGTRAVEIYAVRILDADGREARVLTSGSPGTIELCFRAAADMDDVVFGIIFYREDGLALYGVTTAMDGVRVPVAAGEGVVRFRVSALELLEGQYDLDVAATAPDGSADYDYRSKNFRFSIYGSGPELGVARLAHEWEIVRR